MFPTFDGARRAIRDEIHWYKHERLHLALEGIEARSTTGPINHLRRLDFR